MFQFSARFEALQREAGLAAQLLGSGVTILRSANHAQEGCYNQALFNLSIGLERAAKLALVLDYCVTTRGKFPPDAELRRYGHDLVWLFEAIEVIRISHEFSKVSSFPDTEIHRAILQAFSDFAKVSRYYNLDYLAKGSASAVQDPIAAWFARVGSPILTKHYSRQSKSRDKGTALAAQELMGAASFVLHKSEIGSPISSIAEMFEHGAKTKVIQKWGAVLHFAGHAIRR
jgi:hypothetical protein